MYIIKIKHRGDTEETEYPIYNKEEAKENDITYIPWKDADTGDNALSDDGYVSKVLSRRDYTDSAGRKNIYMRFPFGYTFFSGLNEDYTLELLKEAIELAQGKKDISNLLKAVDNLQEMHGMKEKHVLKTTDTIEAFSSVKLIDELKEEEKSLTIQRTQIEEKKEESDE